MHVTTITGEQLIREISKRQELSEISHDFPKGQNRRRRPRLRTLADPVRCRVTAVDGGKEGSAFLNFSDTGALLQGPLSFGIDSQIEIFVSFDDTGETFVIKAVVVRRDGEDIGVHFS